jgi:UDP-3-O-[3-hydroxymyristoyl] glucosamine N-acyltransferase
MISSKNIRFHVSSNTYIVPKNSTFDQNVSINGNVIVGTGVHFFKNVKIFGDVQIGKGCTIEGNLSADNIIVGSRSQIKGNIIASGNVSLFQNSAAGSIKSGDAIIIMEGCTVDYADSKRLEIIGKADIKRIGPVTKVTVKANTVLPDAADEIREENEEYKKYKENNLRSVFSKNNEIEQLMTQPSDEMFAEIMDDSDEDFNSLNTPSFQMENSSKKTDAASENLIENNSQNNFNVHSQSNSQNDSSVDSSIPEEEFSDVEILENSESSEQFSSKASSQKAIETPFGTVFIDDIDNSKPGKSSAGSKSSDVGAELIIESYEEDEKENIENIKKIERVQKSESKELEKSEEFEKPEKQPPSPTKKPWPQFEPRSGSKIKSETANHNSSSASQISKPVAQHAEKRNATNASKDSIKNRQANQKVIFEEIEPDTKPVQKLPEKERKQEYIIAGLKRGHVVKNPTANQEQMQREQTREQAQQEQTQRGQVQREQTWREQAQQEQTQRGQVQREQTRREQAQQEQMQREQMKVQEVLQEQERQGQNKEGLRHSDSEKSREWYEERSKKSGSKRKEYPPYI